MPGTVLDTEEIVMCLHVTQRTGYMGLLLNFFRSFNPQSECKPEQYPWTGLQTHLINVIITQLLVSSILYLLGSLHTPTSLLRKWEKFTMAVSKVIPSQTKSSEKADQNYLSSWLSALLLNSLEEPSYPFPLFYPSFHTQLFSKLCNYDTFTL